MTLARIAAEANVPEGWVRLLISGKNNGPSVDRVQAVYELLSGRKLIG